MTSPDRIARPIDRPLARLVPVATLAFLIYALAAGCGGKPANGGSAGTGGGATPPPAAADSATAAPVAGAPDLGLGARVFTARCALCHGPQGYGDGPASKALNPKPRNFHDTAYMSNRTDAELLRVIHEGKGAMPAWGKVLSEDEMRAALAHVRSLGTH